MASDTETPRQTAPAPEPETDAKTPVKAPAETKPEADVKTPAKAPVAAKPEAVAKTTPQATKPKADVKTPAKTARRATGTTSRAKTARRATGTRSPANTARRATAKTAPRATRPISEPVEVKGALKHWTETGRKVTEDTLELYVKTVDQLADAEVKAAQAIKLPIVATMAETNAAVRRRIATAYVAVARNLLKA